MDVKTWAYIIGALVLLVVVAAFWRRLLRVALVLGGLAVAVAFAWAFAMQATATKQTATAATVSAAGSTVGNIAVILLAGNHGAVAMMNWIMSNPRRWAGVRQLRRL